MRLCKNAMKGMNYWFCYHWNGNSNTIDMPVNSKGLCGACAKVDETKEEVPSWLKNED